MSAPRHILVVEASEDVRNIVIRMLEARGCRVSSAASAEAMRLLLTGTHGINAVILDATLSGKGADTLVLHAKARGLPVVMISGNPDHMEFAEIHRLQLLRKPFRRYDLYDALDKALASGIHGQRDA